MDVFRSGCFSPVLAALARQSRQNRNGAAIREREAPVKPDIDDLT
jgi:hypothetical protein